MLHDLMKKAATYDRRMKYMAGLEYPMTPADKALWEAEYKKFAAESGDDFKKFAGGQDFTVPPVPPMPEKITLF